MTEAVLTRRRSVGGAGVRKHVIKFRWELVPKGGDEVVGAGLEVLILGNDGRIRLDYQFIEG